MNIVATPKQIGAILYGLRIKAGLTQVELSKLVGIHQCNYSGCETGARPIGKRLAIKLGDALKVDYKLFL